MRELKRARRRLLLVLAASGRLAYRGNDPTVANLAANAGFAPHDLLIARVAIIEKTITIIIIPKRLWYRHELRNQLLLVKRRAENLSIRVLLVPEAQLAKQPRLNNASAIAASSEASMSLHQRMKVISFVRTEGITTFLKCTKILLDHSDPRSAILSLVHAKSVHLDLDRPITDSSLVRPTTKPAGTMR